ncbi:MAG: hypothetical protein HY914_20165 [Desulfomonile tiedjei]|nr:hypothetical protein [Desulfomonile tiedjei]
MADSEKRKVSAKQIVTDIRAGMDRTQLKRKYGLSDTSLETVCRKLVAAKALSEAELRKRGFTSPSEGEPPQGPEHGYLWYCPACHQGQEREFEECPACGVVVEKFLARQTGDAPVERASVETMGYLEASASKSWTPVVWSVVAVMVLGAFLLIWSRHRAGERTNVAAVTPKETYQKALGLAKDMKSTRPQAPAQEVESSLFAETEGDAQNSTDTSEQIPIPKPSTPLKVTERPPGREFRQPTTEPPRPAPPRQEPRTVQKTYATGTLRLFTAGDFKQEVVEASKVYPVLFQFYSDT